MADIDKDKTCCFFGHRKIDETAELKNKLCGIIENLIVNEKIDTFLFGSKSQFDDLCHKTVTDLKEKYQDNSRGMMLYVCSHYPQCDAYVRTHAGTKIPVGSMANHELRSLRKTAHHYFDQLHKSGFMTKDDAYYWLASIIDAPMSQAHIGYLSEYYCKQVIEKSKEYLERCRNKRKNFNLCKGGAMAS